MKTNLSKVSYPELARFIRANFGAKAKWVRKGKFCLIQLDSPDPETEEKRIQEFDPYIFFDPTCPGCRQFIEKGAFIVFDGTFPWAARFKKGGQFEVTIACGLFGDG